MDVEVTQTLSVSITITSTQCAIMVIRITVQRYQRVIHRLLVTCSIRTQSMVHSATQVPTIQPPVLKECHLAIH